MPRYVSKADAKRRRNLYEKGLSDTAIGRELGIDRSCITKWRLSVGLPSRYATKIPREALSKRTDQNGQELRMRLYADGLSDKDIGERLGVSPSTISSWRQRHKLSGSVICGPIKHEENAIRMLLYELGWSDRQIAKQREVHLTSIAEWRLRRHLTPNAGPVNPLRQRKDLASLAARVRRFVDRSLASDIADDAVGELCLALLSGSVRLADVEREGRRFGNRALRQFANMYGPRSIDEEIGEDGFTLLDMIADDSQSSWLEEMGASAW